jgi:hypothetical protein
MSITSDKLIETIITQEPKGPGEIKLEFINSISVKELFMFCMELFNELSKYKYGNADGCVDISMWSYNTIEHLNKYYNSISLKMEIKILENTPSNLQQLLFYKARSYDKYPITHNTILTDIYYTLYHPITNNNYIINFGYLS